MARYSHRRARSDPTDSVEMALCRLSCLYVGQSSAWDGPEEAMPRLPSSSRKRRVFMSVLSILLGNSIAGGPRAGVAVRIMPQSSAVGKFAWCAVSGGPSSQWTGVRTSDTLEAQVTYGFALRGGGGPPRTPVTRPDREARQESTVGPESRRSEAGT